MFKIPAEGIEIFCPEGELMDDKGSVLLRATDVWYYSPHDEAAFFEWLDKIEAVRSYGGQVNTLDITVSVPVDEDSLRELIALFYRYRVDMSQLRSLDSDLIGGWFRDPRKFWFEAVFGDGVNEAQSRAFDTE